MVYELAGALTAAGNPVAALDVLDESEQAYQRLGEAGAIDATSPLLDVRARRADAMRHRGWTALAGVEINIVAEFYYQLVEGPSGGGHLPGLARVLVLNADILSITGDPSLACASADHAIHLITSNMDVILAAEQPVASTLTLLAACRLSSTVHAAQGRWDLALEADEIGVRTAESLLLVDRQAYAARLAEAGARQSAHLAADPVDEAEADRYRMTLAAALRRAVELEIDGVTAEVLVLAPGIPDVQVWAPSLRCDLDVALERAKNLCLIGLPLLRNAEPAGVRICMEAHAMFAFTFESWSGMSRAHHHHYGPYWTAMLRELNQIGLGDSPQGLADDLANWSLMIDRLVSAERHF
jgi:hypothetical protein